MASYEPPNYPSINPDNNENGSQESDPLLGNPVLTYSADNRDSRFAWRTALNVTSHLLILGLTILYWYWSVSWGPFMLFSWHPGLMITGVMFLLESAMIFTKRNIFFHSLSYSTKVHLHWILQVLGALCLITGFVTIIVFVERGGEEAHFSTYHGRFGLATTIFVGITLGAGIVAKYSNSVQNLLFRLKSKIFHVIFAITTGILSAITILLAFYSHWFQMFFGDIPVRYTVCLVLPTTIFLVFRQPFCNLVKRLSRILSF